MVFKSLPLSDQVRLQILQWIRNGSMDTDNGKLPSESEIAEILNTSRSTVREALSQLENDRIIIRRHGSRTYINPGVKHLQALINELLDPFTMIEVQGFQAKLGFQEHTIISVDAEAAALLEADVDSPALGSKILYLADGYPAIWVEAIFPFDPLNDATDKIPSFISLRQLAYEITGLQATHALSTIELAEANTLQAQQLNLIPGQSIICLVDVHQTDLAQPVYLSRSYLSPGKIKLHLLRNTSAITEHFSVW